MIQWPRCVAFDPFPFWAFTSWGFPSQHFISLFQFPLSCLVLHLIDLKFVQLKPFSFCLLQQQCNLVHNHHRQVLSAVLYRHEKKYFMHISHMTWTKSFLRPLWPLYIVIMRQCECNKLLKTPIYVRGFGCVCEWASEYSSSILGQLLLKARARNYANEFQIPRDFQGPMTSSSSSPADETPDCQLGSSGPSSIIHTLTRMYTR